MKILYDHQIFKMQKFGGISRYFNELTGLSNVDVEIDKIDPDLIPDKFPPSLLERGINLIKRKSGLSQKKDIELPLGPSNKIKENNFDIFHPTYFSPYFLNWIKKPFVLTVYDMLHEIYPESFGVDKTSQNKKLLCDKADKIIAISETTKNDIVNIFDIPEEKIRTIHLASDFDKIIPSKPQYADGIENFILFTGSRWTYKNFTFTTRAISQILKADKSLLFLCTGHAFSFEELSFFKDLGIQDQVKHMFLKNDNELAWAYQNAKCFIFPSLYEGFGFPILEAFACSCPVVSSTGGSLKEIGGEGVLFFDPKNFKEIQDMTNAALYNTTVRNDLINKGKKEFDKYSWDKCRLETVNTYHSIISK